VSGRGLDLGGCRHTDLGKVRVRVRVRVGVEMEWLSGAEADGFGYRAGLVSLSIDDARMR